MVACLGLAFWRARDRFGALAIFAGSAAMLAYTIATDFTYGWQKTIQFSGVFVATAIPVAVLDALTPGRQLPDRRRWLAWAGTAAIAVFMGLATIHCCLDILKWSKRKVISADWFDVREASRGALRGKPVTVDASSFSMGFFYGMWAPYFLPESQLSFALRGVQNGGYLRGTVRQEDSAQMADAHAVLMGRAWADAFDLTSPRLLQGREYALLERVNRVTDLQGVYPVYGLPNAASAHFSLTLQPNATSRLTLELAPREIEPLPAFADGSWLVVCRVSETETHRVTVSGPPPWRIEVPLAAGQSQTINFTFSVASEDPALFPFGLAQLRLTPETAR